MLVFIKNFVIIYGIEAPYKYQKHLIQIFSLIKRVNFISFMETNRIDIADNFFGMIKNLSTDVKLELISKITDSLKGTRKEFKDDSWKELFGAWQSDQSAEEIIEDLRSSRYTNRQIEDL